MPADSVYSWGVGIDNGTVLVLITILIMPVAAIAFARSGGAWQRIGKGDFAIEREAPPREPPPAHVERAEQVAEARQMLEARSYRRQRNGEPPLDMGSELSKLLEGAGDGTPSVDDELREEVRRLVIAGNERRLRRGEEPLDVEAETERQLSEIA
jgi:cytochrome P450